MVEGAVAGPRARCGGEAKKEGWARAAHVPLSRTRPRISFLPHTRTLGMKGRVRSKGVRVREWSQQPKCWEDARAEQKGGLPQLPKDRDRGGAPHGFLPLVPASHSPTSDTHHTPPLSPREGESLPSRPHPHTLDPPAPRRRAPARASVRETKRGGRVLLLKLPLPNARSFLSPAALAVALSLSYTHTHALHMLSTSFHRPRPRPPKPRTRTPSRPRRWVRPKTAARQRPAGLAPSASSSAPPPPSPSWPARPGRPTRRAARPSAWTMRASRRWPLKSRAR